MKIFLSLIFLVLLFNVSILAQSNTEEGIELYRSGNLSEAIRTLKNSLETNENDVNAWLYLGGCYLRMKNNKSAREAFKKANSLLSKIVPTKEGINFNDGFKIISKPRAGYTDDARSAGTQGTIKLAIEFGGDGKINFIFPVQTLPYGLTESTIAASKKIKYEPAQKDGNPVSMITIISYNFAIY